MFSSSSDDEQGVSDLLTRVNGLLDGLHRGGYPRNMKTKPRDPILNDVFDIFGGQSKVAKYLSVTRQSVTQWEKVPLKHVRAIARYTGLSPAVLRPDIYADI